MKTPKYRYLAEELKKYYRKLGRRRIFRNGMNQNELVDKIAVLSGHPDLEANSMTRAIHGERLLQDYYLDAFCRVLELNDEERWKLWHAALQDRASDFGFDARLSNAAPVIDMLVLKIELFEEAMADENFRLALIQLANLYTSIEKVQGEYDPTAPLLRILVMAENERQLLTASLEDMPGLDFAYEIELVAGAGNIDTNNLEEAGASVPLSVMERELWRRYFDEGLTTGEIAGEMRLTEATVLAILEAIKGRIFRRFDQ